MRRNSKKVFGFASKEVFFKFLADTLEQQQGRCAYSGALMSFIFGRGVNCGYAMSVERVSSEFGYTRENIVLVCRFFNVGGDQKMHQWSHQRFVSFPREREQRKEFTDTDAKVNTWLKKSISQIHSRRQKFLKRACGVSTLTISELRHQLEIQQYRCFYTGMMLSTLPKQPYLASVERIDNNKPYTASNIVIILCRLNTSSCQWSREVAERFWPLATFSTATNTSSTLTAKNLLTSSSSILSSSIIAIDDCSNDKIIVDNETVIKAVADNDNDADEE